MSTPPLPLVEDVAPLGLSENPGGVRGGGAAADINPGGTRPTGGTAETGGAKPGGGLRGAAAACTLDTTWAAATAAARCRSSCSHHVCSRV